VVAIRHLVSGGGSRTRGRRCAGLVQLVSVDVAGSTNYEMTTSTCTSAVAC